MVRRDLEYAMPKNQSTDAKKARQAARDGAKYTAALRGQELRDIATAPEGWEDRAKHYPAMVAVFRDVAGDRVVAFDRATGDRLAEMVLPHVSAEETRRAWSKKFDEVYVQGSPAHRALEQRVELGVPDRMAHRIGYETAAGIFGFWTQWPDGSWRSPAEPHGRTHFVTATNEGTGVRLVVTQLPDTVVLDRFVKKAQVDAEDRGQSSLKLRQVLDRAGYTIKGDMWSDGVNGQRYQLAELGRLAQRDWWTKARLQLLRDVTCGSPEGDPHTYKAGEEVVMHMSGRAGREVKRDAWWSSTDIDYAKILDPDQVKVVEVLENYPPTWMEAALDLPGILALIGEHHRGAEKAAAAWLAAGLHVAEEHGGLTIRVPAEQYRRVGRLPRDYWDKDRHTKPYEAITRDADYIGWSNTVRLTELPMDPVAAAEEAKTNPSKA